MNRARLYARIVWAKIRLVLLVMDWRILAALAVLTLGVGSIGSTWSARDSAASARAASRATSAQLAASRDQLKVVRESRDDAIDRAQAADDRADAITDRALTRLAEVACTEYRTAQVASVFAQLVAGSPTASDAQRALVAPFVVPPPTPVGC